MKRALPQIPRTRRIRVAVLASLVSAVALATAARAPAAPPQIGDLWSGEVAARTARLNAEVQRDPSLVIRYHFNYITAAAYAKNVEEGKDPFLGAFTQPAVDGQIAAGAGTAKVSHTASNLRPETLYRYRLATTSIGGAATSAGYFFVTQALGGGATLPDGRGWELVSPLDKNGGEVEGPGEVSGGGVLQASADGEAVTYSSSTSFGADAAGAPVGSQYISRRGASSWSTENITTPMLSGSYGSEPRGVPYQLFSGDLAAGLLLNGRRCRGEGEACPVANPPLPGTAAPAGYRNYYLRANGNGTFEALLDSASLVQTPLAAEQFELAFAGASSGLEQVVLSSCATLAPGATEATTPEGCDPALPNLYRWFAAGLELVNLLPAATQGTPGASLAAQSGSVSADGSRVYWTLAGNLYLRENGSTKQVDASLGGGGRFETAAVDGSVAFFSKGGHLYRYAATSSSVADLTPAGGLLGVLGASDNGSRVYYRGTDGLFLRDGGTTTEVAADADASNYPPATGAARVTPDGTHLAFVSDAALTSYDNKGLNSGQPTMEVYLYDAGEPELTCVSCNPTNGRPIGPSTLPGATRNGEGPEAVESYKPRALADDGDRVFFDSEDALVLQDTNAAPDLYQWESRGTGSCAVAPGCVSLLSGGKAEEGGFFVDASSDGADVFFRTDRSLVAGDPGSFDLYDARVGGGFPTPPAPLPCEGDACQSLPPEPRDPTINTTVVGSPNPPVRFFDTNRRKPRYHRLRNHRHEKKRQRKRGRADRRAWR